jgi:hypothetical protein
MSRTWMGMVVLGLMIAAPARGAETPPARVAGAATPSKKAAESTGAEVAKKTEMGKSEKEPSAVEMELQELRGLLESQAKQLEEQSAALREQQQKMAALEEQLRAGRAAAAAISGSGAVTAGANPATASAGHSMSEIEAEVVTLKEKVAAQEKKESEPPTAIHIKGITLTPGGFFVAETAWRQRAASADVNTPLTGIPFPGNSLSKVSEFNASGRQSRISLLAEGKIEHAKFTGYYETDFLGAGTTSNNRQSNSYALRQRQFWGQAALDGGWTFTGGQMWSLVTETKKGLNNRTEAGPLTIDAQYNVGFSWARQFGFRVVKSLYDNKLAVGFSVEGSQTTFGGRGLPSGTFFINAPGNGGGLFNAFDGTGYTLNKTPDFVFKTALDPGWGHYELFGVVSTFRARVFPCGGIGATATCPVDGSTGPSVVGAFNDSRTGGGIGVNLRAPVFGKWGDAGVHFLGGSGIGRYGTAQLADATARPNATLATKGALALIRGGQALGTVELHATPSLDIYFNGGVEYAYRTWFNTSAGTAISSVGYGSPFFNNSGCSTEVTPGNQNTPGTGGGTCNGDLKDLIEGTVGFWHRFYKGPKGTLQWGLQYSYLKKNVWSGNNNNPTAVGVKPTAIDNMVFSSFRYYLP